MLPLILIYFLIAFQGILLICACILAYWLIRGVFGVPYIRSEKKYSKVMLELANVTSSDVVVDFGSGDGSIVIHAAKTYGAHGIGFEHLYMLVLLARFRAFFFGVGNVVSFKHGNFLKTQKLPHATVICSYLFPEVNAKLEPLLIRDYPSGTRVVSRTFLFPTLRLKSTQKVGRETIYLYEIP